LSGEAQVPHPQLRNIHTQGIASDEAQS